MRVAAVLIGVLACAATSGSAAGDVSRPVERASGSAQNQFAEVGGPNSLAVSAFRRSLTKVSGRVRGSGDLLPGVPGGEFEV